MAEVILRELDELRTVLQDLQVEALINSLLVKSGRRDSLVVDFAMFRTSEFLLQFVNSFSVTFERLEKAALELSAQVPSELSIPTTV